MKQGIVVTGSEATGTKILADAIIKSMGVSGTIGGPVIKSKGSMLLRRSIPHGRPSLWPKPSRLASYLTNCGCDDITVVVTTREWFSIVKSHQRQDKEIEETIRSPQQILEKVRRCYNLIFQDLAQKNIRYVISNYESLITDPKEHLENLAIVLGLPFLGMKDVEIRNENEKYKEVKYE